MLSAIRLKAVKEAFAHVDRNRNGLVELSDLEKVYDVERRPEVLRGEKTGEQVLMEFLSCFSASGETFGVTLSLDDFINYYVQVGEDITDDAFFVTLVRRTWQLDQPQIPDRPRLRAAVGEGFNTSAYRGHREQPQGGSAHNILVEKSQLSIDPFSLPKPGQVAKSAQAFFDQPSKTHHKVRMVGATSMVLPAPETHSTVGKLNQPGAYGFLEDATATQRNLGTGAFSDEAMAVFEAGKAREREAELRRYQLQAAPFQTAEPASFERSSQIHSNLLRGVNREMPANLPRAIPDHTQDLQQVLEDQRAALRANLTLGKLKTVQLNSTQREHYARNAHFGETGQQSAGSIARNGYETEYSSNMLDRSKETTRVTKYDAKGTFRLVNGVVQMHPLSHHPLDIRTGTQLVPTNVVPNQFSSTTQSTF